jgi:hypothetical protein
MITAKENAVLRLAGFTQREINDRKRKFYNLLQIEPWLLPMLKRGEWVGLTDEEIVGLTCECIADGSFNMDCARDFARAIEAKLKEKNDVG